MLYREDKYGNKISQLGYGCMRFTKNGRAVDLDKAEREVMLAIDKGVNYFDTAYIYAGNEEALGHILHKNSARERINIATKLPQYMLRSMAGVEKTFKEELSRLRTTYIDYYLMHMFTDIVEWENLQKIGIEDWIRRQKAEGTIRNIGFSYHGDTDMFLKLLYAYDWDFCQIQYNYLDEHSQAGRRGLEAAGAKGIPVIIMEPLRGGKLVELPDDALLAIRKHGIPGRDDPYTAAELGLRWLWDQPYVTCVLSGMNSTQMVEENIRIAQSATPGHFTEEDQKLIEEVKSIIKSREKVGCTGCRYCMPCHAGVDIPGNFYFYNLLDMNGPGKRGSARHEFIQVMGLRREPGFASLCVECGACEKHCPQHIEIRKKLKEADRALRPLPYRIGIDIARKLMLH